MSLSLQNSSKIAFDEKIRAKWLPAHQPYQSKRSQVSKSSPKEALDCLAAKTAIQQTIVSRRKEEVRDVRREQED